MYLAENLTKTDRTPKQDTHTTTYSERENCKA